MKLRLIHWLDSRSMEGWSFGRDMQPDPVTCISVGVIVRRSRDPSVRRVAPNLLYRLEALRGRARPRGI